MKADLNPMTAAMLACAEIRCEWMNLPGNQRPPIHDHAASMDWWQRWRESEDKAECDRLLSDALGDVLAVDTLGTTQPPAK